MHCLQFEGLQRRTLHVLVFTVTQVYKSCSTACPIPASFDAQRWAPCGRALRPNLNEFSHGHNPRFEALQRLMLAFPSLAMISLLFPPQEMFGQAMGLYDVVDIIRIEGVDHIVLGVTRYTKPCLLPYSFPNYLPARFYCRN